MAHIHKGQITAAGEWWRHLRWTKRVFWKGERQAGRKFAVSELRESSGMPAAKEKPAANEHKLF